MNIYLFFSDAAKYAIIARDLVQGSGYATDFSFFIDKLFTAQWISPLMPYSIAAFFKLFGVSDLAVILTSVFYFVLTLIFVFLLAKYIYKSRLIALLSTAAVGFNYNLVQYATGGASESPFIFEIVAASYFVSLKKRWASAIATLILVLMYFTRPQAIIYIAGTILYWLFLNFKTKKAWSIFGLVALGGLVIDKFVLAPLAGKFFLYSILGRGSNVLSQVAVSQSASEQLRSGVLSYNFSLAEAFKKVFYNLYNFYKLLPQIVNPYIFALFVIGLLKWSKERLENSFKAVSLFVVVVTLLVTAASIPFFRYIHPIIPFVYIIGVATAVKILSYQFSKKWLIVWSTALVILLAVGQTLGVFLLDSRFERNTHNVGKPPVYAQLSYILRDNTDKSQTIVTNLDTWGSWYGERKTIWFPLEPKQLIDPATGKIPFDAIYLTSYLIDDENYYMGSDWRLIFDNPNDPIKWTCDGCSQMAKEYRLAGIYKVPALEDYERQDATAILLIKR